MSTRASFIIGTRGSKLALGQTEGVASALGRAHPGCKVRVETIRTGGDIDRDTPLSVFGGTGAFTSRLEAALAAGRIDVAVHSLKDLPTAVPEHLPVAAVCSRVDNRDVLVSADGRTLDELRSGAVVGTSSVRRAAQLRAYRGDLVIRDIRGNVETRISRVRDGEYSATVLAAAGLLRLGLEHEISEFLDPTVMYPAPGQGALAVQCRNESDILELLAVLDEKTVRGACEAERTFLQAMQGGCSAPIGARAVVDSDGEIRLEAAVFAVDGSKRILVDGAGSDGVELGRRLAGEALSKGAGDLVAQATAGGSTGKRVETSGSGAADRSDSGAGAAPGGAPENPDARALRDVRVLLPMSAERSTVARARLLELGADIHCIELIDHEGLGEDAFANAFQRHSDIDWIVLTSPTAARRFFELIRRRRTELLDSAGESSGRTARFRIAAVGPATADAVRAGGWPVDFVPGAYRGAALAEELPLGDGVVLLPQAEGANPDTARILEERGARVSSVATYRITPRTPAEREREELAVGFDWILLTSGATAESLSAQITELFGGWEQIAGSTRVICIGPTTADRARALGVPVDAVAPEHTLDGLIDVLLEEGGYI